MSGRPRRKAQSRRSWLTIGLLAAAMTGAVTTTALASTETPLATDQETVTKTIEVSGTFDGGNKRFVGSGDLGNGGQDEGQDPLFKLTDGAVLKNVIIGAPAADGVHCEKSCTLRNVVWEDVGEDAATFRGSNATVRIEGGAASKASDKVFQDNRGAGGSVTISDFEVSDFGTLYRSCGNCSTQAHRDAVLKNITVSGGGKVLAGININYGDTVKISRVTMTNGAKANICNLYEGNSTGAEPKKVGSEPDGEHCVASDIVEK